MNNYTHYTCNPHQVIFNTWQIWPNNLQDFIHLYKTIFKKKGFVKLKWYCVYRFISPWLLSIHRLCGPFRQRRKRRRYWSTVLNPPSLNSTSTDQGHPFLRCRTRWSILCVLMYQRKSANHWIAMCVLLTYLYLAVVIQSHQPMAHKVAKMETNWSCEKLTSAPFLFFDQIWKASREEWPVALQR